ncbi:unnamed protein product [Urochloa humidicola]
MRTMTIPSATMRRLKQAAAAARAATAAVSPAPVLRRPAGGGGGGAARVPARVHRPTSPSSGRRHATAGARVRSNGRAPVRANQAAPPQVVQASSNYSSSPGGKRRATAPPPPPASGREPAVRAPPPEPPVAPTVAVGDRLLVRTPVTNTLAGQHVVMTIGAVVVFVSAAAAEEDGGYLEVILDGDFPPQDPSSPVRITRDQIVVTTPASTTTVPRLGKREAGGSATSLRGAEERRSLQNVGLKRSRY